MTMAEDADSRPFTMQPGLRILGQFSFFVEHVAERILDAAPANDGLSGKAALFILVDIAGYGHHD